MAEKITHDGMINIPEELKALKQWVLWKLELKEDGKTTKIPYQTGIGFVLSQNDEYVGIDFDNCISEDGVIDNNVNTIIENCNSYTEISQSGHGIHIILKGSLPRALKKEIEMYSENRFFTVTGNRLGEGYKELLVEQNKEIKNYDFSDLGIAQRFKEKYKDILKYALDTKYFYHWDGKKWTRYDDELPISSMSIEFVEDLAHSLNIYIQSLDDDDDDDDDDEIKIYRKIVSKLKNDRTISMISKRYKSFGDTHIYSSIMDSDVRYINCNNGVVDIISGTLLPHNKDLYISKIVNINYFPNKVNEQYKNSISRLFNGNNEETTAFEILLGYMLSGKANQKTCPIIHGCKDSGKSKVFELILATFGADYVKTIDKELLMKAWNKSSSANPELAELQGVRLLICSETSESDYLNTDFIKKLVGGDTIKARPLYKPPIEFRPLFTPVIFTNGKPSFDGNDDALVGRITTIELLHPLKKEEIDPDFEKKVLEDKEGVFSYLIDCVVKFNTTGKLMVPQRWEKSKKEYVDNNNDFKAFINEVLEIKEGNIEYAKGVYDAFDKWLGEDGGGGRNVPTPKKLTIELKKAGVNTARRSGTVYLNVFLIEKWRQFGYKTYFKN